MSLTVKPARLERHDLNRIRADAQTCYHVRAHSTKQLIVVGLNTRKVRLTLANSDNRAHFKTTLRAVADDTKHSGAKDEWSSNWDEYEPNEVRGDPGEYWEEDWSDDDWEEEGNKKKSSGRKIPAEMRYFDTAKIYVKAGDGGDGVVAFRREKHVPYGGPNGGNGGDGGSVFLVADDSGTKSSLRYFRQRIHWKAARGLHGGGSLRSGKAGKDVEIPVPLGTIVRESESGKVLAEVLKAGERVEIIRGGRGGRGNHAFKHGKNRAPIIAENGEEGQEMWLNLEMKLVADVGIVGMPNAGKSTLLSVLSSAKPKIRDYPFTTLVPNLGVFERNYESYVIADIPGILEGAHTGKGLGQEFLRHCERTKVLIHLIDGSSADPVGEYDAICTELKLFNPLLADKPKVVVVNKMDITGVPENRVVIQEELQNRGVESLAISAATGEGTTEMMFQVTEMLKELPKGIVATTTVALEEKPKKLKRKGDGSELSRYEIEVINDIEKIGRVYVVSGVALERLAQMTNWEFYEAVKRFQSVLKVTGVSKELKEKGCKEGDTVVIGDVTFEYSDEENQARSYEKWLQERGGSVGRGSRHWPHGM